MTRPPEWHVGDTVSVTVASTRRRPGTTFWIITGPFDEKVLARSALVAQLEDGEIGEFQHYKEVFFGTSTWHGAHYCPHT